MRAVAALALAAATARIEAIDLIELDSAPALRVSVSGHPGVVALHHENDVVHLVVMDAELGPRFGGSRRLAWTASSGTRPDWLAGAATWLESFEIDANAAVVHLAFGNPAGTEPELRSDLRGLAIVLRRAPRGQAGAAAPRARREASRSVVPAELSVALLYPRLFPAGSAEAPRHVASEVVPPRPEHDASLGPFQVRASLDARYVNADTFLEATAEPTRDEFLEIDPLLALKAPLGAARLSVDYRPALRAFATYDQINSNSHAANADLELPLGGRLGLRVKDNLVVGTLDTRIADPGGEYFSGLGRFRRNEAGGSLSVLLAPRTSLELAGGAASLRFLEPSSFFGYEARTASAGIGLELTPNLKAVACYVYDRVPRPRERPEAESRAHSARLTLSGDVLPLVNGELGVGYRSQSNPNAGADGRRYSGLTLSGRLTRQLSPESSLSLFLSRATPASAYEGNGFYVATGAQAAWQTSLPFSFQLRGGLGWQRNEYRVAAVEPGRRRLDRLWGWSAGLRRALGRRLYLGGTYRAERRRSTLDRFDTHTDGFVLQLEWDAVGGALR